MGLQASDSYMVKVSSSAMPPFLGRLGFFNNKLFLYCPSDLEVFRLASLLVSYSYQWTRQAFSDVILEFPESKVVVT